jgi:hypothetical protein
MLVVYHRNLHFALLNSRIAVMRSENEEMADLEIGVRIGKLPNKALIDNALFVFGIPHLNLNGPFARIFKEEIVSRGIVSLPEVEAAARITKLNTRERISSLHQP